MTQKERVDRKNNDLRPLTIETNVNLYAEGSTLIRCGNTHVLCTATVEESVPRWLMGKEQGWVTAEYSMLPRSTHTRVRRDRERVSGRTQEIQRLIGRALRSVVDLKALGERTLLVDCDVLQADGGTRTASITGGCVALILAINTLFKNKLLEKSPIIDTICGVSVGIKDGQVLTDLDYNEDSSCDVDMNFVITGKNNFVEVQGTAEGKPFSKDHLDQMTLAAVAAANNIKQCQLNTLSQLGVEKFKK